MAALHPCETGIATLKVANAPDDKEAGVTEKAEIEDPFNLRTRFCKTQKQEFEGALREIQAGKKRGCWSWYIFPTAPYIEFGYEDGSYTNKLYALRDKPPNHLRGDDCTRAFLRFEADGVNLRNHYLEIMTAVAEQLESGVDSEALVGRMDDPKLRSSLRLFERISRRGFDEEVNLVCLRCLRAMDEPLDPVDDSSSSDGETDGSRSA